MDSSRASERLPITIRYVVVAGVPVALGQAKVNHVDGGRGTSWASRAAGLGELGRGGGVRPTKKLSGLVVQVVLLVKVLEARHELNTKGKQS